MPDQPHLHEAHPEIISRLRHTGGHLKGSIEMIDAGRPRLEVAQHLRGAEKAVSKARKTLIQDHLDRCLDEAVGVLPCEQRSPIDEFKEITKYL